MSVDSLLERELQEYNYWPTVTRSDAAVLRERRADKVSGHWLIQRHGEKPRGLYQAHPNLRRTA